VSTIFLGPRNCIELIGLPWRRTREMAVRMGVPLVRAGRTLLVPYEPFRRALDRAGAVEEPETPDDARSAVLAALGRR
jgi:hypothetical protein